MIEAALFGLLAGASLVIGAILGLALPIPQRVIAYVMAFGAGVLVSALAFELTEESFARGGADAVAIGLAAGALAFYLGDRWIDRRGGEHRKRSGAQQAGVAVGGTGAALVLGALLDGIPEAAVIGIGLLEGEGVGFAFVAAVFLSNLPESMSAATGMRRAGRSARYVLSLWTGVMLASGLAALAGYALLGGASDQVVGLILAFAAGAVLTMLADTMLPEAYQEAGPLVGVVSVAGFGVAFLLSTVA